MNVETIREAERDVIGAVLLDPDQLHGLDVRADDFLDGRHRAAFVCILGLHAAGQVIDATTVSAATDGRVPKHDLLACAAGCPASWRAKSYAAIVARAGAARRAAHVGAEINAAGNDGDLDTVTDLLNVATSRIAGPLDVVDPAVDVVDLMNDPALDDAKPWVIPGLLRAYERLILTGGEGFGKSTLLRQIAVGVSSGYHPFTRLAENMPGPQVVLIVDLQEDRVDIGSAFRAITSTGITPARGALFIEPRPQGMNLLDPADLRWLEAKVALHRPAVLIMGPIRKLTRAHAKWAKSSEEATDELTRVLDDLRMRYGFALIMEAHAGHDRDDYRIRGSSVWLDWPEFGFGFKPVKMDPREGDLLRWREDRHAGRPWPHRLFADHRWPWRASDEMYGRMLRAMGLGYLLGDTQSMDLEGAPA